jgi:transposase
MIMRTTEATDQACAGIDLHSSNAYIVMLDEHGKKTHAKRYKNDLDHIVSALKTDPGLRHVAVESTYNWYWLVDGLMEAGYHVHLANPAQLKDCAAPKFTGDAHDAERLAYLLHRGDLPEGYIYPKEVRPVRDVLRRRLMLVRQRTQTILSLQAMIARTTGGGVSGAKLKKWTLDDILRVFAADADRFIARELLATIHELEKRVKKMDDYVRKYLKDHPDYALILTVPGIGLALSLTILLETGPLDRFKNPGQYASYCRAVPSPRISNNKIKGTNNARNGNKYLGWAFVEAAQFAQQHHPRIQAWFQRKQRRTCRNVALKSLAAKLSKATFIMLRDRIAFNEQLLFG